MRRVLVIGGTVLCVSCLVAVVHMTQLRSSPDFEALKTIRLVLNSNGQVVGQGMPPPQAGGRSAQSISLNLDASGNILSQGGPDGTWSPPSPESYGVDRNGIVSKQALEQQFDNNQPVIPGDYFDSRNLQPIQSQLSQAQSEPQQSELAEQPQPSQVSDGADIPLNIKADGQTIHLDLDKNGNVLNQPGVVDDGEGGQDGKTVSLALDGNGQVLSSRAQQLEAVDQTPLRAQPGGAQRTVGDDAIKREVRVEARRMFRRLARKDRRRERRLSSALKQETDAAVHRMKQALASELRPLADVLKGQKGQALKGKAPITELASAQAKKPAMMSLAQQAEHAGATSPEAESGAAASIMKVMSKPSPKKKEEDPELMDYLAKTLNPIKEKLRMMREK